MKVSRKASRRKNLLYLSALILSLTTYHLISAFSFPKKTTAPPITTITTAPPPEATPTNRWNRPPPSSILRAGIATMISLTLLLKIFKSPASALTEQQLLVDHVWREVNRQYVDKTYNGMGEEGWRDQRLKAVKKVIGVGPDEKPLVYDAIRTMLGSLGDPYTRFLTPDQFESLTADAKGSLGGIGLQLIDDPSTGTIVVVTAVPDGPAARGGILPGDIVLTVNEEDSAGATAEVVAGRCRGEAGSTVTLAVRHGGDGSPVGAIDRISLARAVIQARSIESSVFRTETNRRVGVIRVSAFNQETERGVAEALEGLRKPDAVVLDLRGNPGGYMPAGVDVAKLFLPPQARVISIVDRSGRAKVYVNDGVGSDTTVPLYVLVDQRTASASEILTAALQDNRRATVVGTKTFGKGRIQNIQGPLEDGSGIAVTKAKYMTPDGRDINGVGITPDVSSCGSNDSPATCLKGLL